MKGKGFAPAVLLAAVLFAGWAIPVLASDGHQRMVGLQYLVDESGTAAAADVLRDPARWRSLQGPVASFGFGDDPVWLRASVPLLDGNAWLLELGNPQLDRVELYAVIDGRPRLLFEAGELVPFSQRPIPHRNFLFPLDMRELAGGEILLRVRSTRALQIPVSLLRAGALLERTQNRLLLHGLYFGGMLALLLYNLCAFASLRERSYLYLVAFIAAVSLFQAGSHGLSYQFLWPEAPAWNARSLTVWVALTALSGSAFTNCFLQLDRRRPLLASLMYATGVAASLMLLAAFVMPYRWLAPSSALLGVATALSVLTVGASLWRSSELARFFTLALLAISLGTVLLALNKFGFIPRTFLTEHALQMGSAIAALLLSAALARRYGRERSRRLRIQSAARQHERAVKLAKDQLQALQQDWEQSLSLAVRQRTERLEQRVAELTRRNATLVEISDMDEDSGLKNRRFFDERYRIEWRRAFREHYPLALVLIAIDEFRELSERGGREASVQALRQIGGVVAELAGRPADTVARFAKDELAVLMAGTDGEGALHLAESVRERVAALKLPGGELTISAGVAALIPTERHHEAVLLSFADDALYQAKLGGRNRVKAFELPGGGRAGAQPA